MTQRSAERVLEISYTPGTGPIKLARPETGYRSLAEAGCVDGDTVDLMIEAVSNTGMPTGDWEIGTYTWGAGGMLTRTTIAASSNGGAAVSWSNGTRWVRARRGAGVDGDGNSVFAGLIIDLGRLSNVTADVPTTAVTASAPSYASRILAPMAPNVRTLCSTVVWDSVNNLANIAGSMVGIGCVMTGLRLTLRWRCGTSNAERLWIFVDGKPTTAAPVTAGIATTAGTRYSLDLTFATAKTRQVEIYLVGANSLAKLEIPLGDAIYPSPAKPKLCLVMDSYGAGSAASSSQIYLPQWQLTHTLNADVYISAYGGSGWVTPGPSTFQFGHASRIAYAASTGAQALIFVGSVNDTTATGLSAAVTSTLADYAAAIPGMRAIVIGPQASNATDTVSVLRQSLNAAVKSGAAASPAVMRYTDMIGNADGAPRTYVNGTSNAVGELVSHLGSVWQHTNTTAAAYTAQYAPGASGAGGATYNAWRLVTWDLFGTGNSGTPTSDGSRDTLLYSDGIHWTDLGAAGLTQRIAGEIVGVS